MTKIPRKTIEAAVEQFGLSSASIDTQLKVDHIDCPAGRDTRHRLYIKKIGGNSYIAHCFNCGGSGYATSNVPARIEDKGVNIKIPQTTAYPYLINSTQNIPLHVEKYLLDYGVTKEEAIKELKYLYNKEFDCLIMPFYQERNDADYQYQVRFFTIMGNPRYLTSRKDHDEKRLPISVAIPIIGNTNKLFIVEDQISAYRIMRDTGNDAVALMGTTAPDCIINFLKDKSIVYIWMDNDAAGKAATTKIYKKLAPLASQEEVHLVTINNTQAKDLTTDKLKWTISRYL